ncbi:MAG: 50S ribosome-binding GTPase, partial [Fimbriimonadaceae bacterium]|nr:50S ribosome-binding GTPase [Fimbriimonadaceae bacterium]
MKARLPVVVIVGRPNVGKSTLFNRVVGRRVAVVEDSPGITRDRLYAEAQWGGKHFVVVDTGGILFSEDDPLTEQIRVQAEVALAEADVVVFMADLTAGVTPDDWDLAEHLRRVKKPILVVVNKTDNPQREQLMGEFFALGLGDVFPISSLHGRGVAEVLDAVAERVPKVDPEAAEEDIRVAIVGRPNVGKS